MNSLRYLVSSEEVKHPKREASPLTSGPGVNLSGSTIKTDVASQEATFVWRVLILILSLLHLHNLEAGAPAHQTRKAKPKKPRTGSSSTALPPIPRLFANRERKLLVLDLDETLIHSMSRGHGRATQMVEVQRPNSPIPSFYYVAKRPFCTDFLTAVLQWYDVAIFTASVSEYADPIIDLLERDIGWRCFKRRLYRNSCIPDGNGGYIKDLRVLNQGLSRVLLVDNSPVSFAHQRCNGLTIDGWISDPSDRTLLQLLPLLFALRHTSDVRSILSLCDSKSIPANWG